MWRRQPVGRVCSYPSSWYCLLCRPWCSWLELWFVNGVNSYWPVGWPRPWPYSLDQGGRRHLAVWAWTYLNSVTSLKDDFFKIFAGLVQLAWGLMCERCERLLACGLALPLALALALYSGPIWTVSLLWRTIFRNFRWFGAAGLRFDVWTVWTAIGLWVRSNPPLPVYFALTQWPSDSSEKSQRARTAGFPPVGFRFCSGGGQSDWVICLVS